MEKKIVMLTNNDNLISISLRKKVQSVIKTQDLSLGVWGRTFELGLEAYLEACLWQRAAGSFQTESIKVKYMV